MDKCTKPNEVLKRCGTPCPLTCEQPVVSKCSRKCMISVCECDTGYYR